MSSAPVRHRDMIAPSALLGLVRNTVPYWFDGDLATGGADMGWLAVLHGGGSLPPPRDDAGWEKYFELCLACHHATVASYVPTDVDTKIRAHCWQRMPDRDHLLRLLAIVDCARGWTVEAVSKRVVMTEKGPLSGHDGEFLSVLTGALGAFHALGDAENVDRIGALIDEELKREARAFESCRLRPGDAIDLLRLSAILTHNAGDIDQGFSGWSSSGEPWRKRFARLAHENVSAYGGAFQRAASLYKRLMAAEGHRHYPLREVPALRKSADLLLPIGPFFDQWGETIARHDVLSADERIGVLAALIGGCKKVANQVGYYRAIAGFVRAHGGSLEKLKRDLPSAQRRAFDDTTMQRQLATSEESFLASIRKQTLAALKQP